MAYRMEYGDRSISDAVEYADHDAYGAVLEGLLTAVRRIRTPCFIALHVNNAVVASMFRMKMIEKWSANGWKTSKGNPVKEAPLWQTIAKELSDRGCMIPQSDTAIGPESRAALERHLKSRQSR